MEHPLKAELYRLVRESPEVFEFIQSGSLDGMWYWNLQEPEHEWMSPRFWETFGYDPQDKQHLSSEWQDIIFPEDRDLALRNFEQHVADPNHPYDQVVRYKHKDGSTVWIRCRGLAIRNTDGEPVRMLGAHTDITAATRLAESRAKISAQKQSQRALEKALREKTALLSEVHHRVKNNLQIISSMLSLQARTVSEPVKQELESCQRRVQAMALIHQLLYEREDYSEINLGLYTARLCELIQSSTRPDQAGIALSLHMPEQPLVLGLRRTVPYGLVINELLSNAYQHAFSGRPLDSAEINVTLAQAGEQHAELSIRDNGVGLPAGVGPDNRTSLGLHMVEVFVRQLQGELNIERSSGTTFAVKFPLLGLASQARQQADTQ